MRPRPLALLSLLAACSPPLPAPRATPAPAASSAAAAPGDAPPSTPACAAAEEQRARLPGLLAQGRLRRSLQALDEADSLCPEAAPRGLPARLRVVAELGLVEQVNELLPRAEALGSAEGKDAVAFTRGWLAKGQPLGSEWTQKNPTEADEHKAASRKARAEASEAARKGQWAQAKEKYLEAWQSDRSSPEALAMAAAAARQAGQGAEARRLGDRALTGLERAQGKAAAAEVPDGFGQASDIKVSPDGSRMAVIDGLEVRLVDTTTMRLLQSLSGHTKKINGVAFSPDGKVLASCSEDYSIRLWESWSGEPLGVLSDRSHLYDLAFSPDGSALATLRYDKISVWDLAEKKISRQLNFEPQRVKAVGFMPDSRSLWVTSENGAVKLWDLASGKPTRTVLGTAGEASMTAVSPEGKTLAVGGFDRGLGLWDMTTGNQLVSDKGYITVNSSAAFSPDGRLFAAIAGGELKIWDVAARKLIRSKGDEYSTKSLAFSQDSRSLFTGGETGEVKEWSLDPWKLARSHQDHSRAGDQVSLSRDGKTLALGREDGTVVVWDLAGSALRMLKGHQKQIQSVALSPDGKSLVSAGRDRAMLWSMNPGQGQPAPEISAGWSRVGIFAPDGKSIVVQTLESVKILDATTAQPIRALEGRAGLARRGILSPDGRTIAAGTDDRSVLVWDVATGKKLHTLRGGASSIDTLAYSPDSKLLAGGGKDGPVALWEASSGKPLQSLDGGKWITGLAFSPDSKALATLDFHEKVRIWDASSGKLLRDLPASVSGDVVFSPDGKTIASGAISEPVPAWEVATGKRLHTLRGHTKQIERVLFSPDGSRLITIDSRVVRVWDAASGALVVTLGAVQGAQAGYALAPSGRIEIFGEQPQAARDLAFCRVGPRIYPFWLCEESVEEPGLLAKILAGAPQAPPGRAVSP